MVLPDLPFDVIYQIFTHLDRLRDVSRLARINRSTHYALESSLYCRDACSQDKPGYPALYRAIANAKSDPEVALTVARKALNAYSAMGAHDMLTGTGVLYHHVDFVPERSFFSWYPPVMLAALRGCPRMLELVINHKAGCDIDLGYCLFDYQFVDWWSKELLGLDSNLDRRERDSEEEVNSSRSHEIGGATPL